MNDKDIRPIPPMPKKPFGSRINRRRRKFPATTICPNIKDRRTLH